MATSHAPKSYTAGFSLLTCLANVPQPTAPAVRRDRQISVSRTERHRGHENLPLKYRTRLAGLAQPERRPAEEKKTDWRSEDVVVIVIQTATVACFKARSRLASDKIFSLLTRVSGPEYPEAEVSICA